MQRFASGLFLTTLVAATAAAADPLTARDLGPRTVRYTYEAKVTPPAGSRVLEVWLPLPREDDQRVLDVQLGGARATTVRLSPSGDRAAYVRIENPAGVVVLSETATVARNEVRAPVSASRTGIDGIDPAVFAFELGSTPVLQITDEIRRVAREQAGRKGTVVTKARALYDWVFDHMQYDKSVPGYGLGDIPYCLKVGKGNCTDFHSLFIALARTSGIPARWNIGFPLAYGDGKATGQPQAVQGYHCWAEFYAPGAGWVPVDISEARKHPELKDYFFGGLSGNRVLLSRGRDLLLEPDGTGRRLNYFIYPVARADGQDVPGAQWTFSYADVTSRDAGA